MPKRDFVEENPYLVYSGDSAVSYDSDSGSGNFDSHDIVIACIGKSFSSTASDYTIEKGSYADIVNKLKSGKKADAFLYCVYDYSENGVYDSYTSIPLYDVRWNDYNSSVILSFAVVFPTILSSAISRIAGQNIDLVITDDGVDSVTVKRGSKNF